LGFGLWALGFGLIASMAYADDTKPAAEDQLSKYFTTLEQMKLIDVESGNLETLRRELGVGEQLLRDGAYTNAAVALYAIVKSPRYSAFTDFVEFQNAEYDLAVALSRAGAYGAALEMIDQVLRRGPAAPYWGPAHRRAVDIAIETRDHAGVLARLEAIKTPTGDRGSQDPIPVSAAGERAYLRGRAFYDLGKLGDADAELMQISKKSRLYSSAVYLRGVIRARRGQFKESAEAMCEIAGTPASSRSSSTIATSRSRTSRASASAGSRTRWANTTTRTTTTSRFPTTRPTCPTRCSRPRGRCIRSASSRRRAISCTSS
jgi:tetratricopeptide (TPR) repeat protein